MNTLINEAFPGLTLQRSTALPTVQPVSKTTHSAKTAASETPAFIHLDSEYREQLLTTLGPAGALVGCTLGFLAMPGFPYRETMSLLLVPMTYTYFGFAAGLFSAMFISRLKK